MATDIDDEIAEAAAGWVARLQSSDATELDRQQFRQWLDADERHATAYEEMSALWGDLKDVRLPPRRGVVSRLATAGNIVGLCLVGMLAFTLHEMGFIDRWRSDYYTAVGEIRTVMLEDGSRVDLNTDTAIAIAYSGPERRIRLLRGEAFFDVAKNPQRPFVVQSGAVSATALGTRYSVGMETDFHPDQVVVEEGRVAVETGQASAIAEAGDMVSVEKDGTLKTQRADSQAETAWRDGKLVFSGRPLGEVLAMLSRYRHGRIVVMDDLAAGRTVSGVFDISDIDQALDVLEKNLPVTVTRLTDMLVIVRSR